ncbi:neuronal cell adhesion molecule [Plakobranchus ocellatus]|uniref:Neuronal cell adhesion molecule n=1 Tax=Plakobranchus ocellatus TaxID=259542 RepID=A0AAV4A876_9GAST|nr:neuronal cell adhesion molecule [Plakobranchus ocellatus]
MELNQRRYLGLTLTLILGVLRMASLAQSDQLENQSCHPPSIIKEGWQTMYFQRQEEAKLPCMAVGEATLQYTWTKNGEELSAHPDWNSERMYMQSGVGTLVIAFPHQSDQGYYQCRVSNACGVSVSVVIKLIYAFQGQVSESSTPEVISAVAGQSAVLTCHPPRSVPASEVNWILTDPDHWPQSLLLDDRVTMDYSGNLYITSVRQEDEQHGEIYMCLIYNYFFRRSDLGEYKQIHVRSGGNSDAAIPTQLMWRSHTDIIALLGQEVKMKCIFSGNPLPNTTWEREDGQFDESRTSRSHHELVIWNAQANDSGTYQCSGQNTASASPVTSTFTVVVQSKPMWQNEPTDITAAPGESAEFDCSAVGEPAPTLQWFINGQPLHESPDDPRRTLNGNMLRFSSLTLGDSQVVQCNASNTHGYIWSDTYLFVQESAV